MPFCRKIHEYVLTTNQNSHKYHNFLRPKQFDPRDSYKIIRFFHYGLYFVISLITPMATNFSI